MMLTIDVYASCFSISNVANLILERWLHFSWNGHSIASPASLNYFDEANISVAISPLNTLLKATNNTTFVLSAFTSGNLFFYLFIVAFVSLGICLFSLRIKNGKLNKTVISLKKEQQILIEDFEVTIAALEQSKEEITQQNLSIKQLTIILAHDLQSPFRFIKMATESLHQSILEQQYDEAAILSAELKQSSEYTYRFITDFTLWLRSINKDYQPKLEEVNLYELINDLNHFFAGLLKSRKNKWQQDVPQDLKVFTDKELLKVIVRNIIDNANKHNFERTIKIASHTTSENCAIVISDNGTGLSDTALHHINTYIHHPKNTTSEPTSNDNKHGHKLIAHFSKLLNLDINISSKTNTGTTFRVANLTRI